MEATVALKQLHPTQQQVRDQQGQFNVLKCGRRWGKTDFAIDTIAEDGVAGLRLGYFGPTTKDTDEVWEAVKNVLHDLIATKDEQLKKIRFLTNGGVDFWSMDNPDSGRGFAYHKVIIDECEKAHKFEYAWKQAISPTLADFNGSAWFLSTPKPGKTYFKKLFADAQNGVLGDKWRAFRFTSFDNPFLSREYLVEAKKRDELTFRCEYLAEDIDLSLNPFAYAFSKEKHIKPVQYDPFQIVQLSFDFNVDPITCIAVQSPDIGTVNVIKEFRLENSDIYALCERIKVHFSDAIFQVTGDATGRARSALTSGNINYYSVIKKELRLTDNAFRQPASNPSVGDTRVLVNSIFQNGQVSIDPSCEYLIEDLIYCETDESGDIDKHKDKHRTHLLDCYRYLLNTFHKSFIKL